MKATILLGGNMGNREAYLKFALFHIQKDIGPIVLKSRIYQTEAWGNVADKAYLNQVIELETDASPLDLLAQLLDIEKKAGRTREQKWGNRTLDLDILFLEDQIVQNETLTIPHPEIQNRRFTLLPLYEIKPNFTHPILGKSLANLLDICTDSLDVKIFQK